MNYQKLENIILNTMKKLCQQEINYDSMITKLKQNNCVQSKIRNLENQITTTKNNIMLSKKVINRAYIDMKKEVIDFERYQDIIKEMKSEIQSDQRLLENLEEKLRQLHTVRELNDQDYHQILETFFEFTTLPKALLVNLIDKIYISEDKKIEIHFKFKTPNI